MSMMQRRPRIVVLKFGSGNVRSACSALERAGADVSLSADPQEVSEADGLVVPGVGAFITVMDQLRAVQGLRMIERRIAGARPVLGICVGLQIMFDRSTEKGTTEGLGQWDGTVDRLDAPIIPHMGWTQVEAASDTTLFDGLDEEYFYFVHSYAVMDDPARTSRPRTAAAPQTSWATYGQRFVAAVEDGALSATQFHPEKSGAAGLKLLQNWLATTVSD